MIWLFAGLEFIAVIGFMVFVNLYPRRDPNMGEFSKTMDQIDRNIKCIIFNVALITLNVVALAVMQLFKR